MTFHCSGTLAVCPAGAWPAWPLVKGEGLGGVGRGPLDCRFGHLWLQRHLLPPWGCSLGTVTRSPLDDSTSFSAEVAAWLWARLQSPAF